MRKSFALFYKPMSTRSTRTHYKPTGRTLHRVPKVVRPTKFIDVVEIKPARTTSGSKIIKTISNKMPKSSKFNKWMGNARKAVDTAKDYKDKFEQVLRLGQDVKGLLTLPGSGTSPKGKSIPLRGSEVSQGSSAKMTETKYVSTTGRQKAPDFYRGSLRMDFITNNSGRFESVAQKQMVTDMTCLNQVDTAEGLFYNNAIFNGNIPTTTSTNQGALAAIAALMPASISAQTSQKVYYSDCKVKTLLTNNTNTPIIMDVYELIAKHDSNVSVNLTAGEIYSPATYWNEGISGLSNTFGVAPTATTGGAATYLNLGTTPFQSMLFNEYWEVAAKFTVNMTAGSTHDHTSEYNLDKQISGFRYQNSALLQGITRNIMIVFRGVPAFNSTDATSVIGSAGLIMNQEITYKSYVVAVSGRQIYYADTELAVAGGDNVVGPADSDIQQEQVDPSL